MTNARGFIKDHTWVVEQCKAAIADAREVSENTDVIRFVMDSASANRKAYKAMRN